MADIAQIGFRADTSDLADAKVKLEALTPAAGRAEKASEKLSAAMNGTGSAAQKAAAGIQGSGSAAFRMAEGYDLLTGKMNKTFLGVNNNIQNLMRMSSATDKVGTSMKFSAREGLNFSRQFADIGVTAFMGMNPLLIAVQQLPQLFDIVQEKAITTGTSIGAVFRAAGAAIWTALAPILPIIAGIALAVGVVAAAFALGAREINKSNQTVVDGLGLTEKQLERVKKSGVDTAVTVGDTFFAFFDVVGDRLYSAFEGPLKWLKDTWNSVLDFLVTQGSKNIEFIVGAFTGALYAIRNSWKTLPAAIGDIIIMTANATIFNIEWMINKTISGINRLLEFANGLGAGFGMIGNVSLGRIGNPLAGSAKQIAGEISSGIQQGMNESKGMVGRFWADVGAAARKRASDRVRAAAGAPEKGRDGSTKGRKEPDTFETVRNVGKIINSQAGAIGRAIEAIQDRMKAFQTILAGGNGVIEQLELERDALFQTTQTADRARIMYDLLAQARQANIELTPTELAALGQIADKQAMLNEEIRATREALDFAKGSFRGFIGDLINGAREGQSIFKTFGDAILNVLDRILDKMLDVATEAAFSGGGTSGIIGFLGKAFGLAAGVGVAGGGSVGSAAAGAIHFAKGGAFDHGIVSSPTNFAIGQMGEAGPEGVLPLTRGPDGSLGVQMYGGRGSGGSSVNNVEVHNHYHLSGAISSDDVQRMVRSGAEQAAEQTRAVVRRSLPTWLNEYEQSGALT